MPPKKHKITPKKATYPYALIIFSIFLTIVFILYFRRLPLNSSGFLSKLPSDYPLPTINLQLLGNLPVPEVGHQLKDKNIAIPIAAVESTPGAKTKIRQFTVQVYKGIFQPNTILVYAGDIVRINLIASDNIYDLTIPALSISQTAQKGETKSIEFQATSTGTFPILCTKCTQGRSPRGALIVKSF